MDKKILSLLGLSLAFSGCQDNKDMTHGEDAMTLLKRSEWERQLQKVAETPAPKNLEMGAMCYSVGVYQENVYSCSVCLQKTVYDESEEDVRFMLASLTEIQQQATELYNLGLPIKLVSAGLCTHCSPDGPRELQWEVMNGERQVVTAVESYNDYYMLKAFAEKKLVVKDMFEEETPLKNYLPRLRQLLGLEEVEAK